MPRSIDLQLLVVAMAAGAVVAWTAGRRRGGRVGTVAVLGALVLAGAADRRLVHALPREVVDGYGSWALAGATAVAVGWGAGRLPAAPTFGLPPVLPLALASLAGVWVGVPETSAAILAAGVLVGLAAVLVIGRVTVTPAAAIAVAVVPVGAACAGAADVGHALVGGLLCSATLVVIGLGPRVRVVPGTTLVGVTALHLAGALIAARHVGVSRDWGGTLPVAVLVIGLSLSAAVVLRRGQGRVPS